MSDGLREVRLLGHLGERFGARHRLLIASPAEAVRALVHTRPGFERAVIDSERDGIAYRVLVDDEPIDGDALHLPSGRSRITIAPVLAGAGGGGGGKGILGGIALIALSFVPGLNVAIWSGMATTWSSLAFSMGVSMVLGGISSMLASSAQAPSQQIQERPENKPSYLFNGPVNTTQQGHPVPMLYGEAIIGGQVISSGVRTTDTA